MVPDSPADQPTLRDTDALVTAGLIAPGARDAVAAVERRYAIAISPAMRALIAQPDDPIGRQFIPDAAELITAPHEHADPIADDAMSPIKGVVHRYPDRALLKPLLICPVYCRFCFRREMVGPGKATALSPSAYDEAIGYIRAHPEIWEVILTGGDPLMLSPRRLAEVMADLAGIDHVRIIRIHTRVPVADPARVSPEMIAALRVEGASTWVALHANHARELTGKACAACAAIVDAGIPMVSQSVLLRGVNDNAAELEALMRAFVECRIKPYYLHHGDLAPGTSHLRTTLDRGQALMRQLRGRVSGLCQPEYVLDIPGGHGKSPVGPGYLSPADSFSEAREPEGETRYRVVDYCGDVHLYPPTP